MLFVGAVQIIATLVLSVNSVLAAHRFSGVKSRSIHIFTIGMFCLALWNLFHFFTNIFRDTMYFYVAIVFGYFVIQALIFFSGTLEHENMLTAENVLGLILLAILLAYLVFAPYSLESFFLPTGDYIVMIKNLTYRVMETLYVGYGISLYTYLTLKISRKTKNTKHYKYAMSLFVSAALFLAGGGGIIFLNLLFLKNIFREELVHLSYAFSFIFPLIYAVVITTVLLYDPAILWIFLVKLHYLFVFKPGGIPIFSYTFQEKHKHENSLVASMISAIVTAISEITETNKEVKQIIVEDRIILLTRRKEIIFALIADKLTRQIRDCFYHFADLFTSQYTKSKNIRENNQTFCQLVSKSFPLIVNW